MTDHTPDPDARRPGASYDVVVLVEQPLSPTDVSNLVALHEGVDEPVRYHVLLPVEDPAARVESAIGALGTGEMLTSPPVLVDAEAAEELRHDVRERCDADVAAAVASLEGTGARAVGLAVTGEPVDALVRRAGEVDAREVIVLTRPHVVAELFHVDWTSRARRKLGVPVLHLLEHESFEEQAGDGEGISGF
ncbi:hypothetical protein [Nocardioides aurantiacus]|uniref:Universal stress protein family protein n=1 Tax=Nocardioides aurantiacus TaxID=86796 RepID=A0A3N2CSK3_9ACTN|nr:hypothetical protein [Nocardioides aurantiacus]ROR90499.1 hypothetical protein EDD33_1339 [Nocardioides aurantiacus]